MEKLTEKSHSVKCSFGSSWRILPLALLFLFLAQVALSEDLDESTDQAVDFDYYYSPISGDDDLLTSASTPEYIRGSRYCEIMPVFHDEENNRYVTESYNTFILTPNCNPDAWEAAESPKAEERFIKRFKKDPTTDDAVHVIANGPRLWIMDETTSLEGLGNEEPHIISKAFYYVEGLGAVLGAQIQSDSPYPPFGSKPYKEDIVNRWTRWTYYNKSWVFELVHNSEGVETVYIMQSIDLNDQNFVALVKSLVSEHSNVDSIQELVSSNLFGYFFTGYLMQSLEYDEKVWSFRSRILDTECDGDMPGSEKKCAHHLDTYGEAYVLHDNLGNGYQRVPNSK